MQEICPVLKAKVLAIVHAYLWPFRGLLSSLKGAYEPFLMGSSV